MKIFLSNLFFASTILAAPDYLDRRQAAGLRPSRPFGPTSTLRIHADDVKDISDTIGDTAWAGAIASSPSAGATIDGAQMQFEIPQLHVPTEGDSYWVTGASVGIDGFKYTSGSLQAGVLMELTFATNGRLFNNFTAWYSWFPGSPVYLPDDFNISINDSMWIGITMTSNSAATVTIIDETNDQQKSYSVTSPSNDANLEGLNAEWVLQSLLDSSGTEYPLPDFETITFTACSATAGDLDLSSNGAQLVDILGSDNTFLTQSSLPEDSTVQVVYLHSQ